MRVNKTETQKMFHLFLCKLPWDVHEQLEDYRLEVQRRERRWVPKRELVEAAIRRLVNDSRKEF